MKKETPVIMIKFFEDFIFPCTQSKSPACDSWKDYKREGNLPRGLYGLNLEKARIFILDYDSYKGLLTKEQQEIFDKIIEGNDFVQETPRGGKHYFFRQPRDIKIGCDGSGNFLDFKGVGGYVCLYDEKVIEAFKSMDFKIAAKTFFKRLPIIDVKLLNKLKVSLKTSSIQENKFISFGNHSEASSFGPGNNNRLIPIKGHEAIRGIQKGEIDTFANNIIELVQNNPTNPDIKKHVKDQLGFILKDSQSLPKIKETLFTDWENVKDEELTFIDRFDLIPEKRITLLAGKTSVGKTQAMLSYLSKEVEKPFIYFSDGDNMPQETKKTLEALGSLNLCKVLDFETVMKAKTLEEKLKIFLEASKKFKSNLMFLDPFENLTEDSNSSNKVSYTLGHIQNWASENGISLILAKNFRKGKVNTVEDHFEAISGSAKWTTVPRSTLICSAVDPDSLVYRHEVTEEQNEDKNKQKVSVMWQLSCNMGLTKNKLLFKWDFEQNCFQFLKDFKTDNEKLLQDIKRIDSEKELDRDAKIILVIHSNEKNKKTAGEIKLELAELLKVSERSVQRYIKEMIDKKIINSFSESNQNFYSVNTKKDKVKEIIND